MSASPVSLALCTSDPKLLDHILPELRAALAPEDFPLDVFPLETPEAILDFVTDKAVPHLVLFDLPGSLETHRARLLPILRGLRGLDSALCVLILTDKIPSSNETMTWLDAGATGLLQRNFKGRELPDPLQEALLKRLNSQLARQARVDAHHQLNIRLANIEQAMAAETLNIGTGGMFVRTTPRGLKVGTRVQFEFLVSSELAGNQDESGSDPLDNDAVLASASTRDPLVEKINALTRDLNLGTLGEPAGRVRGEGIVAWIRPTAEGGMPEGVGIQFRELDATARDWINQYVTLRRVKAFIPKS